MNQKNTSVYMVKVRVAAQPGFLPSSSLSILSLNTNEFKEDGHISEWHFSYISILQILFLDMRNKIPIPEHKDTSWDWRQ